jgi:hypothetical protein
MKKDREDILQSVVNASGFAFQLKLEHRVRETRSSHGWDVLTREHPWSTGERSGFADLILEQGIVRLIIECKRPRDANWVFLVPEGASEQVHRCRAQWADASPEKSYLIGWDDFSVSPASVESEFCSIRGQGEGDRSLLERLSGDLIASLPAIANDDFQLSFANSIPQHWIYIPVIVTTAKLEVCRFSLADVDLLDGTLRQSTFETVPYLRFRKSLAHKLNPHASGTGLHDITADKMRTILVVNSEHLPDFLEHWDIGNLNRWIPEWPWTTARRIEQITRARSE